MSRNTHLMPALLDERKKMLAERERKAKKPVALEYTPIRTSTAGGTYATGDGEVLQAPRPGSMDAYSLPSLGIRT